MGGGYPMFMGTGGISSPIGWRGLAGTGISGDRGGDGGVIPGHPRPRCHLERRLLATVALLPANHARPVRRWVHVQEVLRSKTTSRNRSSRPRPINHANGASPGTHTYMTHRRRPAGSLGWSTAACQPPQRRDQITLRSYHISPWHRYCISNKYVSNSIFLVFPFNKNSTPGIIHEKMPSCSRRQQWCVGENVV
jgi:hypothetical protein